MGSDWLMGDAGKDAEKVTNKETNSDIFAGINIDNLSDRPVDRQELLDLANELYSESLTDSSSLKPDNVKIIIQRIFKAINLEWKPIK